MSINRGLEREGHRGRIQCQLSLKCSGVLSTMRSATLDSWHINAHLPVVPTATLTCCFTDQGNYLGNDASSIYNALTIKVDKRFSQGLQFMSSYNYSHAYHYDSNFYFNQNSIAYGPDDNLRNHLWVSET